MAKSYSISVNIGGKKFYIIADEKPDYLTDIAKCVDESISEIMGTNKNMTFERAAVLSALKFCDDSRKLQNDINEDEDNLRKQVMQYSKELSKLTRENKNLEKQISELKKEYESKIISLANEFTTNEKESRQVMDLAR